MISIIIPVYNVENYLRRCLDSCLSQTYADIEIIAINDGSKDHSGIILDEYSQKDCRIKVIHKKNEGVFKARIVGLENMKGDYFCFLDSDDYLPNDCLKLLHDEFLNTDADIVFGNYVEFNDKNKITKKKFVTKRIFSSQEYIKNILLDKLPSNLWGKLYRKELFDNKIEETTFKLGEDSALLIQFLIKCKKIVSVEKSVYNYYQRADSAVHLKRPAYIADMYFYRIWICDYLQKNNIKIEQNDINLFFTRGYIRCVFWGGLYKLPPDEYNKRLKTYSNIKTNLFVWERMIFRTYPQKKLNQLIVYSLHFIRNIINVCQKK